MKPIEEFIKDDHEEQPLLVLKTDNGLLFIGEWDFTSGHFFIDTLITQNFIDEQKECLRYTEIPGRCYLKVVEFLYLTDWKHGAI